MQQAGKEGAEQSGAEQQRERLTRLLGGSLGGGASYSSACSGLNNGTLSMN